MLVRRTRHLVVTGEVPVSSNMCAFVGIGCTPEAIAAGRCGGTTTSDCPAGTRKGLNGQCFFVDPGCLGPNCGPVTTDCPGRVARNSDGNCPTGSGCPGGVARNSDGNCPTTTSCTGGKIFDGSSCRCGAGMADKNGTCVRTGTETKKPKKTHKTRRPSDSDNPGTSAPSIPLQIQIGPGFPGGGRPGRIRAVDRPRAVVVTGGSG